MLKKILVTGVLLLPFWDATDAFAAPAWKDHVDWMWQGDGACWKAECLTYVVEWRVGVQFNNGSFGPLALGTVRGTASPRDCVNNAKKELAKGNRGMAIAWLQAGQLHNPQAQQDIAANADAALSYISGL